MPNVITDPATISSFESAAQQQGQAAASSAAPSTTAAITDPSTIASFEAASNANQGSLLDTIKGQVNAVGGGLNQGIAQAAGAPVSLYNLVGDAVAGKGMSWVLNKLGVPDAADWIKKNGYQDIYTGSPQSFVDAEKNVGLGYDAQTPGQQMTKDFVGGATGGSLIGALTGGLGPAADVVSGAVSGTSAGMGANLAQKAAEPLNNATQSRFGMSLPQPVVDFLAGLVGGGGVPSPIRGGSQEAAQATRAFNEAGIAPKFAADVNPNIGTGFVPKIIGAKGISQTSAQDTQSGISDYARNNITQAGDTTETIGQGIATKAQKSIDELKTQTDNAWTDLRSSVPSSTVVDTTNTNQALGDLVNRATDPSIKAIVANPTFQKYSAILKQPQLSYSDMDILRSEVGSSIDAAEGAEQGLLKQVYKGIMDDMRTAVSQTPDGLAKFDNAYAVTARNGDIISDTLKPLLNKNPEQLPGFLTQQSKLGGTRLNNVSSTPGFTGSTDDLGRSLLSNAAGGPENFDVGKLMKFWNAASPEAKQSLMQSPEMNQAMSNLKTMYDSTAASRGLIGAGSSGGHAGSIATGLAAGVGEGAMSMFGGQHGPWGMAAAASPLAIPVGAAGAAMALQRTSLGPKVGAPITGYQMPTGTQVANAAGVTAPTVGPTPQASPWPSLPSYLGGNGGTPGASPNVPWSGKTYGPHGNTNPDGTPMIPQVAPEHVRDFLSNGDQQQVAAYVGSKLGPAIGSQVAQAGSAEGHNAAMFQLLSSPVYRRQLLGALAP